jgi:DTW domain-containing protein YfiP
MTAALSGRLPDGGARGRTATRMTHAVFRLRAERIARSTRPFVARGSRSQRCAGCRLPVERCLCGLRPRAATRAGFCLLMHEAEPLKTSNTGWLVADVVPDTGAFAWSRTQADPRLLALLADPRRQPYVVFPAQAAAPERVVGEVASAPGRRPLFVLLDATWAEARKMFRRSPYLDGFPVLGFASGSPSRYLLRRTRADANLCTAEVAAMCLRLAGESDAAAALEGWLDLFVAASMRLRGKL